MAVTWLSLVKSRIVLSLMNGSKRQIVSHNVEGMLWCLAEGAYRIRLEVVCFEKDGIRISSWDPFRVTSFGGSETRAFTEERQSGAVPKREVGEPSTEKGIRHRNKLGHRRILRAGKPRKERSSR